MTKLNVITCVALRHWTRLWSDVLVLQSIYMNIPLPK